MSSLTAIDCSPSAHRRATKCSRRKERHGNPAPSGRYNAGLFNPSPCRMSAATSWLELPSPFDTAPGSLLLADPPLLNPRKLKAMLLDERYPKPFVIDDGEQLTLYFNIRLIQSVMRLDAPNALELRYTRKMMGFLLFNPRPKHIALIGMGGGSLVKFCHQRLPQCEVTAIELDADVLAFRELFRVPPDGPRLKVLHTDGAAYLAGAEKGFDAILVDAFDKTGFAPALASRDFIDTCYAKLSGKGCLVINLAGDKRRYHGLVEEVAEAFEGRSIVVPVRGDGNNVLFAFRDARFKPVWRLLEKPAKELQKQFGLDFPDFLRKFERAARKS